MKLTDALQFYIRYRRVPGLIRFGKTRVIPPISINLKRKVAKLMVIEKDNIDLLNKPYLSLAEETAYYSVVERVPYKNDKIKKEEEDRDKIDDLRPHYTTAEMLDHLKKDKKWE
ncbi:unnamed protein product [Lymnaea stagnalis]|uniref:Uncharacterized protein n=1 Tax=Lymnaea stagnalis TaxID=6523 RepID=A0AAV2INY8_LYMST